MKEISNKLENFFKQASQTAYSGQVTAGSTPITSVSDHLPITWKENSTGLELLSWNMLSDAHLYNAFHNVANLEVFKKTLGQSETLKNNHYTKNLNMFFYELAAFAKEKQGFGEETKKFEY